MIEILHTADLHADKNYEAFTHSMDQIKNKVAEGTINLVAIAGDTFDHKIPAGKLYTSIMNDIKDLAEYCSVLLVQGTPSHDFSGCYSPFQTGLSKAKYPIHVVESMLLEDDTMFYLIDEDGEDKEGRIKRNVLHESELFYSRWKRGEWKGKELVTINAMSWPTKSRWLSDEEMMANNLEAQHKLYMTKLDEYFDDLRRFNKEIEYPSIFVSHLQLEGTVFSNGQDISSDNHPIRWVEDLADYVALGHIHKHQPYYSGSIYNKSRGEMENKYYNLVKIENRELTWEPIKLDTPKLVNIKCNYDDYKKLKKSKKVDDVELAGADVWIRVEVGKKGLIDVEKELAFWEPICLAMRLEVESIKTDAVQRLEEYDSNISLLDKYCLYCKQKGIEVTEFQENKIKEIK